MLEDSQSSPASDRGGHASDLALLLELLRAGDRSQDAAQLASRCLNALLEFVPDDLAFFLLLDGEPPRLRLVEPRNLTPPLIAELAAFQVTEDITAYRSGPPPLAEQVQAHVSTVLDRCGVLARVFVPLYADDRWLGLLTLAADPSTDPAQWQAQITPHHEMLTVAGNLIGSALGRLEQERRRRIAEEWFQTLFEDSWVGVWETDAQGRLTVVNDAMLQLTGLAREDILNVPWLQFALSREKVAALFEHLERYGQVHDQVLEFKLPRAEVKALRLNARAVRDASGEIIAIQGTASDATDRVLAYEELDRQYRELAALNAMTSLLAEPQSLDAVLRQAMEQLCKLPGVEAAALFRMDADRSRFDLAAVHGAPTSLAAPYSFLPIDPAIFEPSFDPERAPGLLEYVILTGRTHVLPDLELETRWDLSLIRKAGFRSGVVLPVPVGERVYGVLAFGARTLRAFDEQAVRVFESVAAQLGLALYNRQLISDLERQLVELKAIVRTGELIQYSPTVEEALPAVAVEINRVLNAGYVVFHLLRGDRLEFVAASDTREVKRSYEIASYEQNIMDSPDPWLVNDADAPTTVPRQREILYELGLRSSCAVRLYARGRALGILFVNHSHPHFWTENEARLIRTFAHQISAALENKRLLDETQKQVSELQALAFVAQLISGAPKPDEALPAVTLVLARVFGADYVSLHLRRNEQMALVAENESIGAPKTLPILPHQRVILDELGYTEVCDRNRDAIALAQREYLEKYGIVADLGVPLLFGQHAIGILYVSHRRPHKWSEEERRLAQTFAQQVASALKNAELLSETERQVRNFRALAYASDLLAKSRSPETALPLAAQDLAETLHADYVGFHILEGDHFKIITESRHEIANLLVPVLPYYSAALKHHQTIVINNREVDYKDPDQLAQLRRFGFMADLGAPMLAHGNAIGILFVSQRQPRVWRPEEVRLVATFAQHIASVYANVRLLNEKEQRLADLQRLANLTEIAFALPEEEGMTELALSACEDLLGADIVALSMIEGDDIKPVRLSSGSPYPHQPIPMTPFLRSVVDSKKPLILDAQHPQELDEELWRRVEHHQVKAFICAPMWTASEPVGLLSFSFKQDHLFTDSEIKLVQTAANQLGMAFANARLYREQKRRIDKLMLLSQFSQQCTSIRDEDALLELAVRRACEILDVSAASARLVRGQVLTVGKAHGYTNYEARMHEIPIDFRLRSVLAEHKPYAMPDLLADEGIPKRWRERQKQEGFRAMVMAPMFAGDRAVGILTLFRCQPHKWQQTEIQLAQALADTIALALVNVEQFVTIKKQLELIGNKSAQLEATLDSAFSGFLVTTVDGVIESWNREAERITGYSEAEMLQRNWVREGPRLGKEGFDDTLLLEAISRNETVFGFAPRVWTHADGKTTLHLREAAAPLRDATGQPVGAVVAFWLLSRELQSEAAVVEALNIAVHELRGKTAALLGSATELLKPGLTAAQRKGHVRVLRQASEEIAAFKARLDAIQHEHLREVPHAGALDLRAAVQECVALVKTQPGARRFRVARIGEELRWVHGDDRRLRRALDNLLSNAVRYSPKRSLISLRVRALDDEFVELTIHNRGESIPPDLLPTIFESGVSGRHPSSGSGLGLWIARLSLREMGGDVCVTSSARAGTILSVKLQRASGPPAGGLPDEKA